jgi:hypothetical protein
MSPYILVTSKTTRGGGYLLVVVKTEITTQREGGYLLAVSKMGTRRHPPSLSRRKQHEEVGTSLLCQGWDLLAVSKMGR